MKNTDTEYLTIPVLKTVRMTQKAVLIKVEDSDEQIVEKWVPLSLICPDDAEGVVESLDQGWKDFNLRIADWWCKKELGL